MIEGDYKIRGIYTDPNPHASVPEGAMLEADNVVLRRDSMAEPRPGFEQFDMPGEGGVSDRPRRIIPFAGNMLIIAVDGFADHHTRWRTDALTEITDPDSVALDWTPQRIRAEEARKNLYLNNTNGVHKLTGPAPVFDALLAGYASAPFMQLLNTAAGVAILDTERVAYVSTLDREDANEVIVVSTPSGRLIVDNQTGADADITIKIYLPTTALEGDTLRLFRSPGVAAGFPPDQEVDQVFEYTLTAADISAGFATLEDALADNDRGRALYTSPSRQGSERGNNPPPEAKDLALFKNSLFAANYLGPQRKILTWDEGGDVTGSATGIGFRTESGGHINGSAIITAITTTGLQVGQILQSGATWTGTDPVRIISIGASTVTMSEDWTAGPGTFGETFLDTVQINGLYLSFHTPPSFLLAMHEPISTHRTVPPADLHAISIGDTDEVVPGGSAPLAIRATVLIEEIKRGGGAFTISASHGDEMYPAVPLHTDTPDESEADDRDHGLWWSKSDQPEHFPLTNRARVGREQDEILRVITARDTLWIFKSDGIYIGKGYGERAGFRFDEFDLSVRLLVPECAVEYDGDVYAWTNEGVVRVNDTGVEKISKGPIGNLLAQIETELSPGNTATAGAFMVANPVTDEIVLGVPSSEGADETRELFIFNTKTGTWVTWGLTYVAGALDPSLSKLFFADSVDYELDQERRTFLAADVADRQFAINITDITDDTVTIDAVSGLVVEVGDCFFQGSRGGIVTLRISDTVFEADFRLTPPVTGASQYYKAFESCLKWNARSAKAPQTLKRYNTTIYSFDDMAGIERFEAEFTSDVSNTPITQVHEEETAYSVDTTPPQERRAHVDSTHSLATQIKPRLCIRQGCALWRVTGMALDFEPTEARPSR